VTQLKKVVEPFGEVNVYPSRGSKTRVVATILMEPHKEGAQTGIALDGSGSMAKLYGVQEGGGILSSIFGRPQVHNDVTPVAQQICAYLARKIDADGGTTVIYWAVGPGGSQVQEVGDFRAEEAERHVFGPPEEFGTGTQLLPAVRYFVDRFRDAPWGFYVFITDGELHDLDAVKQYSTRLAREVAARRRNPLKFVLIGIGDSVNEAQMEELDDLDTGTDVDLWDHKLAAEMRVLQEIFAEVVDKNARVADHGKILDPSGRLIKDYSDTGLPALLDFEMPVDAQYFTLEVSGNRIHQALFDRAVVPPPELAGSAPRSAPPPRPAPAPIREGQDVLGSKAAPPPPPAPPKPAAPSPPAPAAAPEERGDWMDIDLEFAKPGETPDVNLEPPPKDED
jgi:hypothetical protein